MAHGCWLIWHHLRGPRKLRFFWFAKLKDATHDLVSQIEAERRNGYAWYVSDANQLLNEDYPKWKAKIGK